ncbi:fluoride efflux transporter CrcB [Pontibacter arcticus]|uniref:Fluoride-specific ion channel FluC n=1 Tax=Pontibacter arcticus TaxID=2080288 RepID=A0A364RE37_9BACT|nr:fluoride efflux transporter CrcB [Pontibacter arcticus]RAU82610.1 fluoride efflux transporter CrcB [Pontibacter arcticus]
MKILLAIGAGSFIGGVLRYLVSLLITSRSITQFPVGTLTVNLLGCLLIGVVYGLAGKGTLTSEWRLFLATGVLGGFTTFSAFSLETVDLLKQGNLLYAFAYVLASIVLGLMATYLGLLATKLI